MRIYGLESRWRWSIYDIAGQEQEIAKMEKVFGGVANLKGLPAAVFAIDAKKEASALKEAKSRGVVTIAAADTDVDPTNVDYIIPANDDATKSIQLITNVIAEAVEEGRKTVGEKKEVRSEKIEEEKEVSLPAKSVGSKKKVVRKEKKTKETKKK